MITLQYLLNESKVRHATLKIHIHHRTSLGKCTDMTACVCKGSHFTTHACMKIEHEPLLSVCEHTYITVVTCIII